MAIIGTDGFLHGYHSVAPREDLEELLYYHYATIM